MKCERAIFYVTYQNGKYQQSLVRGLIIVRIVVRGERRRIEVVPVGDGHCSRWKLFVQRIYECDAS